MSDPIDREQALSAFDTDDNKLVIRGSENADAVEQYLKKVMGKIENLPSAQPKPKRGKWIYCEDSTADSVDGYRCDQCGFFVPWDYTHKSIDYIKDYNFCPNCGADMRGEQDG